jgi:hypothetical protein
MTASDTGRGDQSQTHTHRGMVFEEAEGRRCSGLGDRRTFSMRRYL